MEYLDIIYKYKDFWTKFLKIVNHEHCEPAVLNFNKSKKENIYEIRLTKPICLVAWPSGRGKSDKVHIMVDFKEFYKQTGTEIEIIQSNTNVYYMLERTGTGRVIVEAVRYDFQPDKEAADDPLVHMHIEETPPDESRLYGKMEMKLRKGTSGRIDFKTLKPDFLRHSRIPTIQMSLPGVLCSLVADHIGSGLVRQVISKSGNTFTSLSKLYKVTPKGGSQKLCKHASARYWYNYEPRHA